MNRNLSTCFDGRRNAIGALRLGCAISVIAGHAAPFGGYGSELLDWTNGQISFARGAVDVFFVMSGFLLAGSWERTSPLEFVRNRCLRIFPGLWVCLIVTGVFLPLAFGLSPGWHYVFQSAWLLDGVHNKIPGLFVTNAYKGANGALWTLPIEVYCYISLAILGSVGLLRRRICAIIFVAVWAGFIIKIVVTPEGTAAVTSSLRLFSFFYAGILLYLYRDKIWIERRYAFGAAAVLLLATILGAAFFPHPAGAFYMVAPVALSYLVIYAAVRLPFVKLNTTTDISYGLYIYGTVVVQTLAALGLNQHVGYYPFALACVGLSVPIAYVSWIAVERPAMALRRMGIAPWLAPRASIRASHAGAAQSGGPDT